MRTLDVGEMFLYTHIIQQVYVVRKQILTGVGLVPTSSYLSSLVLSPHFLQATPVYTSYFGYTSL
jgi:hypothetical protein